MVKAHGVGLTQQQLAAISGVREDVSDPALAGLAGELRTVPLWAWTRLASPAHPPSAGPLADLLRTCVAQDTAATIRLRAVIARLAAEGVEPLILKGAALSHGVYPHSWLRPRNDDDLLVAPADFERAGAALRSLGYLSRVTNPGSDHTGQAHFTRTFSSGEAHHVDLHWRALVPLAFDGLPGYAALRAAAQPLPALGHGAWQMAPPLALMMGCAHRVAHHAPDEDPIWLVDAHLLAGQLGEAGWETFVGAAIAARVAAVCRFELDRAADRLGTVVPAWVGPRLAVVRGEPSARHLRARGRLHRLWLDLGDRPEGRWRALAARVWPSPEYMASRYGRRAARRPVTYLWRAGAGAAQWLIEAARLARSR